MIEITNKKVVKVRKAHECYGCEETIEKSEAAVCVRGKEDDNHVNFHLHVQCHKEFMKRKLYLHGFEKGSLKSNSGNFVDGLSDMPYPF